MSRAKRPHGTGSIFQRKDTGRWIVRATATDPATGLSRPVTRSAATRREAERKLILLQREILAADGHATSAMTLKTWLETWLEDRRLHVKASTWLDYESAANRHIIPAIGRKRLSALSTRDIRALHTLLAQKGLRPGTINKVHRILAAALAAAEREQLIPRNLARLVQAPPVRAAAREILTAEQLRILLESLKGDPREFAKRLFFVLTGARHGEVLALHRRDVTLFYDDTGGVIGGAAQIQWTLRRLPWRHGCGRACGRKGGADCPSRYALPDDTQDYRHMGGGLWIGRPKTSSSWRIVPLAQPLAAALQPVLAPLELDGLVFPGPDGTARDLTTDLDHWRRQLDAAGLPRVDLHSLRHSWATLAHEAGLEEHARIEIMGHAGTAINRHYTRITPAAGQRAVDAVATLLQLE